jgi:2-methylcitrate dehydratase PrpD
MTLSDEIACWWQPDRSTVQALEAHLRRLTLDTVACAIAGLQTREVSSFEHARAVSSPGNVVFPGGKRALNASAAASVGAMAACWFEFCEGHELAHGRPGLHVVPLALALGAALDKTYGEVLRATLIGYEIGARAGIAMRIRRGLHVDGTWGVLGATAAAASLLGMTTERAVAAVGIAASQISTSLYRPVAAGMTARNSYVARAMEDAVLFAQAAAAGVDAAVDTLAIAAAELAGDARLKESWQWPSIDAPLLAQGYLKPYAAVRHAHYGIAAAQQWRNQCNGHRTHQDVARYAERIDRVVLTVYPEALQYCGNRAPQSMIQAQFSLSYAVSRVLTGYDITPAAYSRDALQDPLACRIEREMSVIETREFSRRAARLQVDADGASFVTLVDRVDGDPDQPMTTETVLNKAVGLISASLPSVDAGAYSTRWLEAPHDTPVRTLLDLTS